MTDSKLKVTNVVNQAIMMCEIKDNASQNKHHQFKKVINNNDEDKPKNSTSFNFENKLIVSRMENIFHSFKSPPKYFKHLSIILFLTMVFSISYIWMFLTMAGTNKNNYYCYDPFAKEFRICDQSEWCNFSQYGAKYIVFTDDPTIADQNVINEIYNINYKYLDFFLKSSVTFSITNTKFNMFKEVNSLYSVVFAVTYNEKWNFFVFFNQYCKRTSIFLQIVLILFISISFGNIFFGYTADVFGRKKTLIFCLVCQFIGSLICFYFATSMTNIESENGISSSYDNKFVYNANTTNDDQINNFLGSYQMSGFEGLDINSKYSSQFGEIMKLLVSTQIIQYNFSEYKLLIYIGLIFIFTPLSAISNICLAYALENSLDDRQVFVTYNLLNYSLPISYLIHFILFTLIGNFQIPFLICGVCNIIIAICLLIFTYESPRHMYEFYEYRKITSFFEAITNRTNLIDFYKHKNDDGFKGEFAKEDRQLSFYDVLSENIFFLGFRDLVKKYERNIAQNKHMDIFRHHLIKNPFVLNQMMMSNKHINRNILILIALTLNVGLTFYLTLIKFSLNLAFSRDCLYNNMIINSNVFWLCITMVVSIAFFNLFLKFFGFSMILYISFPFIFLSSLTYELLGLDDRNPVDMNYYEFNSIDIIFDMKKTSLLIMLYVITFFVTGIFSSLYFHLTKLTKTIYRCSFYGIFKIVLDFTVFFSLAISQYFEKNLFYVSVLSVIGFINTYFIQEDFGLSIVDDNRKLEKHS